jgi:hypothetical protein
MTRKIPRIMARMHWFFFYAKLFNKHDKKGNTASAQQCEHLALWYLFLTELERDEP